MEFKKYLPRFLKAKEDNKIPTPYNSYYLGSLVPYAVDYQKFAENVYDNAFFTAPLEEIIRCFNTADIGVYRKQINGKLIRAKGHKVDAWLANPNFSLTRDQYHDYWIKWYYVGGGLLMYKTPGTFYKELLLYKPDTFSIQRNPDTLRIEAIKIGSKVIDKEEDLLNYRIVRAVNPDDNVAGCDINFRPVIKSLALQGDMSTFAFTHQNRQLKNSGKRTGIIESKKRLNPDQEKEIKRNITGLGNKDAGSIAIVQGEDFKFTPMDNTPQELDWLNSVKFIREVIASSLGVPIQLISSEGTTYNNVREFKKKIYNDTINPLLELFCQVHTQFLKEELGDNYIISYDTSNVEELRDDVASTIKSLADALVGLVTFNEFRSIVTKMTGIDLAPLEAKYGDVLLVKSNLSLIDDLFINESGKDDPVDED